MSVQSINCILISPRNIHVQYIVIWVTVFLWLSCQHWQHTSFQIDESVFLICSCFVYSHVFSSPYTVSALFPLSLFISVFLITLSWCPQFFVSTLSFNHPPLFPCCFSLSHVLHHKKTADSFTPGLLLSTLKPRWQW